MTVKTRIKALLHGRIGNIETTPARSFRQFVMCGNAAYQTPATLPIARLP